MRPTAALSSGNGFRPRIGRNPNDPGKDVQIPSRAVVKFKPGKEMRERVLQLTQKLNEPPKA